MYIQICDLVRGSYWRGKNLQYYSMKVPLGDLRYQGFILALLDMREDICLGKFRCFMSSLF